MNLTQKILLLITALIGLALVSCNQPTPDLSKGWLDSAERTLLDFARIDTVRIGDLLDRIRSGHFINIHSVIVSKDNQVLVEEYFDGPDVRGRTREFNREARHEWRSVSKSITSLAIGMTIDQGLIPSVDEPISYFFPEYKELFDSTKNQVRIKDLLSMQSGISWQQVGHKGSDEAKMEGSRNFIRYVLSQPMSEEPGTLFYYNSGNTVLLAGIIKSATGVHLDEYVEEHLFEPLGIEDHRWWMSTGSLPQAHAGLVMRPIDMMKIGQLLLNNGNWNGQSIISKEWIDESMKDRIEGRRNYGYQWWLRSFTINAAEYQAYFAAGNGGQYLFCFPALDLAVVFTAGNYGQGFNRPQAIQMLEEYILPAL